MNLEQQVEVAAQAVHDAMCNDRGGPCRECSLPVLEAAVDVVLTLRSTGDLSRADDEQRDRRGTEDLMTKDDEAAEFYEDPANREFHGPGHRRRRSVTTTTTHNEAWDRGVRFQQDDE